METASAILAEVPEPISTYRPAVSPLLAHTVAKMLSKEVERRYQLAREVHTDLVTVSQELSGPVPSGVIAAKSPRPRKTVSLLWAVGVIAGAMAAGAAAMWYLTPTPDQTSATLPFRNEILVPEGERLEPHFRHGVALSPDGTEVAFVSQSVSSPNGISKIYLHRLDQWKSRPIPGTEESTQPFFSPDGKWLGYVAWTEEGPRLQKVNLSGGEPEELCECNAWYGASWGPDDTIIFAGPTGGLSRVSASGGTPQEISQLDEAAGEVSHRLPHVLPDGKAVLFTVRYETFPLDWKRVRVFVQSLETGQRKPLLEDAADARYVPSGHLVFAREARLLAVPFDLTSLEVTGPEVPVLEGISRSIYTTNTNRETGAAQFSFSATGVLAYAQGSVYPEAKETPVWVDRRGREEALGLRPEDLKDYGAARVSPDGRQVLLTHAYPSRDIWLFDTERGTLRRQTFEGNHLTAIWGPGPERFTVASDRDGSNALYMKIVNTGPGEVERLTGDDLDLALPFLSSWSPDGRRLAFVPLSPRGSPGEQVRVSILTREGKTEPFLETKFDTRWPEFSPDGRWIVYGSEESGRMEIYVRSSRGTGSSEQISTRGGVNPAWSRDRGEIFYRGLEQDTKFYSVKIELHGERLRPGLPVELFEGGPYEGSTPVRSYDVAPDGRFLLLKFSDEAARTALRGEFFPTRIRFIQNWFEELERLAPTGK